MRIALFEDDDDSWVGALEAQRIVGDNCATNRVYRMALIGIVKFKVLPGSRLIYSREDLERVAEAIRAKKRRKAENGRISTA